VYGFGTTRTAPGVLSRLSGSGSDAPDLGSASRRPAWRCHGSDRELLIACRVNGDDEFLRYSVGAANSTRNDYVMCVPKSPA
jgi:hypothetical protein